MLWIASLWHHCIYAFTVEAERTCAARLPSALASAYAAAPPGYLGADPGPSTCAGEPYSAYGGGIMQHGHHQSPARVHMLAHAAALPHFLLWRSQAGCSGRPTDNARAPSAAHAGARRA